MKPLFDGLSILVNNWQLVLVILSLIFLGQLFVYLVMKMIFGDRLTGEEYYSLGMAGWILLASVLSVLWYLLGTAHLSEFSILIFIIFITFLGVLSLFRIYPQTSQSSKATLFVLLLLFCISVPLRLAFISEVLMPQYFDSVRHYTIIRSLLGSIQPSARTPSFQWLGTNYYHVGFHFLAAFLSSIIHVEITKTMLILGQMILAVIPLSLFFIIKHETKSNSAGTFTVLLAGIGWSMPAYAINWGKYPAIASLPLIQFVLSVVYLAVQSRNVLTTQKKWALCVILVIGIILSGFFHSRSLVVIGIAIVAAITARGWRNLSKLPRALVFCLLILGIVFEIIFIQRQEILEPLFNPYGPKGFLVTFIVFVLAIFAQKTYPELAFSNIFGILLLLGSIFVPTLKIIPRIANLTLLDRTFVEIILYFPLSILGGLGLASLEQTLKRAQGKSSNFPILQGRFISVLFTALILGNALIRYEFYPSDCCTIVVRDDLTAIHWIEKNLPSDAHILISSTESIVQPSGLLQGYSPSDAGAWITALTDRATIPWPYDTNLGKRKKFVSLCRMGIDYIYIGASGLSFHAPRLRAHPDWYRSLLSLPRAEVFQLLACH